MGAGRVRKCTYSDCTPLERRARVSSPSGVNIFRQSGSRQRDTGLARRRARRCPVVRWVWCVQPTVQASQTPLISSPLGTSHCMPRRARIGSPFWSFIAFAAGSPPKPCECASDVASGASRQDPDRCSTTESRVFSPLPQATTRGSVAALCSWEARYYAPLLRWFGGHLAKNVLKVGRRACGAARTPAAPLQGKDRGGRHA